MKRLAALALLLLAACSAKTDNADPKGPDDFALSLPVDPGTGAQVRRVELPAAALVALKRSDRSDVRVFDGRGKPLSMALLGSDAAEVKSTLFDAIPFDREQKSASGGSVSVRVDRPGQAVTVDTSSGGSPAQQRSVLIDTRQVKDSAVHLRLRASLPVQRPVTVTVEAGSDLMHWELLTEQVLFRPANDSLTLGSDKFDLGGAKLEGRYLLVSWNNATDVQIDKASLETAATPPPPRVVVPAAGLQITDAHSAEFGLPPGPGPAALRLTMTGHDGVVPVSLLGRDAREQPWTPLDMTVLRQGASGATLDSPGRMRQLKLEADARSAGFSQPPRVELLYEPVTLLVAFNGEGPYKLAVGNANAAPAFLEKPDLTPETGPFTVTRVEAGRPLVPVQLSAGESDSPWSTRNLVLWGSLLLGVAVLAGVAYRLMRAGGEIPASPAD